MAWQADRNWRAIACPPVSGMMFGALGGTNMPRSAALVLEAVIVDCPEALPKPAVPISFSLIAAVLDVPSVTDWMPTLPKPPPEVEIPGPLKPFELYAMQTNGP